MANRREERARAREPRGRSAREERASLRIFLAVFPPPQTQDLAAEVIDKLRRPGDGVSWVKRDNLHYTLRFLGGLGEDGARRAAEAAVQGAAEHGAFEAVMGSLGAFPNARRARVLWMGLSQGGEALTALARSIETALRAKGFGRADRPFAAHLTIGRPRDSSRDWTEALAGANPWVTGERASFRVDRAVVVHSQLSPKGSIYTVRAEAPLAR